MLEHADRRDGVECLAAKVAVVLQADLDPVSTPPPGGPLGGTVACDGLSVMATTLAPYSRGRVDRHRPPPAPHVEQTPAAASATPSFRQTRSCFERCAISKEVSPVSKRAQEYVIAGPSTSR